MYVEKMHAQPFLPFQDSPQFLLYNDCPEKNEWEVARGRFRQLESRAWLIVEQMLGKSPAGVHQEHKPVIMERELERAYCAGVYAATIMAAHSITDFWQSKNSGLGPRQMYLVKTILDRLDKEFLEIRNPLSHMHNKKDAVSQVFFDREMLRRAAEEWITTAIACDLAACANCDWAESKG